MPILSLPTSPGQIAFLCAAIAGFIAFAIGLFCVSVYVTLSTATAEEPVERKVTPARRADTVSAINA